MKCTDCWYLVSFLLENEAGVPKGVGYDCMDPNFKHGVSDPHNNNACRSFESRERQEKLRGRKHALNLWENW